MMIERSLSSTKLELLRDRINDQDYLYEAIQRIAQVLSNELLGVNQGGGYYEQRRKRR